VQSYYKDNIRVKEKQNYILFKASKHLRLPFKGYKPLPFGSKVSGSIAANSRVEAYINTVTRIAQVHFSPYVQYWHEGFDGYGHYNWDEVNKSI